MIKTQEDFFSKIYTSHFICKGSERLCGVLLWEGAGDRTETAIFWPSLLWPSRCVFLILLMLNRRSRDHSAGWWLSLRHLISIFFGPQLIRAQMAPSAWCGFPYQISSITPSNLQLNCLQLQLARRTQLTYIIVRRPLDLWNRMFNRHQAEITVMQFRGHSLPVHHSVVAQWDLHLVPYYQPQSAHAISLDYWPLECVSSFRCITLE